MGQDQVIDNVKNASKILQEESPDKVITLGGNCMVSQAPFDYLHQKYGDDLGILWIDAHPDISEPDIFPNEHAMVLANLIGQGDPKVNKLVQAPFSPKAIKYIGLQEMTADENKLMPKLGIDYHIQADKPIDIKSIQQWINENGFKKLAIHFDIDVLDAKLFLDQYFAKPGVEKYDVSGGKMSPDNASQLLQTLINNNDVVGFTIAEYLPWSALKLKQMMQDLKIFNE